MDYDVRDPRELQEMIEALFQRVGWCENKIEELEGKKEVEP